MSVRWLSRDQLGEVMETTRVGRAGWLALAAIVMVGGVGFVMSRGLFDSVSSNDAKTPLEETSEIVEEAIQTTSTDVEGAVNQSSLEVAVPVPQSDVAELTPPRFDLVRAEVDGLTLVSGTTAGRGDIAVISSVGGETGSVLAEDEIGADGRFALFLDLPLKPGDDPIVLVLRHRFEGQEIFSEDEVIISPPVAEIVDQQSTDHEITDASGNALETPGVVREMPGTLQQGAELQQETPETVQDLTIASSGSAPVVQEIPGTEPKTPGIVQDVPQIAQELPQGELAEGGDLPNVQEETLSVQELPERVPETAGTVPKTPTVLLNTAEGVGVLQAAPLPPSMIALDAIGYTGEGDVQISGRGNDDAFVRVYLNNAPMTSVEVQSDGRWIVDLPDVDTGTYTLRIDQVSSTGQVISRVESPFKREDPEILEQARIAAQDVAITAITVQPGNTLWAIARDRYGDGLAYVSVFEANAGLIKDPDLIYPGQIFTLPDASAEGLPQD